MPRRRPFSGSERRERGAALIEGAVVFPIFFLLVFGLFDGAWAIFGNHVVEGAASSGVRTGSALANDPDADYELLARIKRDIDSLGRTKLVRVVVYKASGLGEQPTQDCRDGHATAGVCNVYVAADLERPDTDFRCQPLISPDRHWCPTHRRTAVRGPNSPPDFIGVWISMRHKPLVGIVIRAERTIERHSVLRVEPRTST